MLYGGGMMRRELYIRKTDGTGRIDRIERDDPAGRAAIDKAAFAALARPDVAFVEVQRVDRSAATGGRGRYR